EDLQETLTRWLSKGKLEKLGEDLQETLTRWLSKGKLEKLAEVWVSGAELDWSLLYGQEKPQRVRLPTYPFAKKRYWFDGNKHRKRKDPPRNQTAKMVLPDTNEQTAVVTYDNGSQNHQKLELRSANGTTKSGPGDRDRELLTLLTKLANEEVTVNEVSQFWRSQNE
ncbi:MAG: hypothetical protein KDJ65_40970, partial [Anaerolineae bacterium]|nr:hypothetical protein [Anaerolineae bacterium]